MKKILSATLALIMLMLSLVSCGESSEYEIPEGLQLVRESKEDGYVFFGPDGWQIANQGDLAATFISSFNQTSITFAKVGGFDEVIDNSLLQYKDDGTTLDYQKTLDAYMNSISDTLGYTITPATLTGTVTNFGAQGSRADKAYQYTYKFKANGTEFSCRQILALRADELFVFTYTAPTKGNDGTTPYSSYMDKVNLTISSFMFTKKSAETAAPAPEYEKDADGYLLVSDGSLSDFKLYLPADYEVVDNSGLVSAKITDKANITIFKATDTGIGALDYLLRRRAATFEIADEGSFKDIEIQLAKQIENAENYYKEYKWDEKCPIRPKYNQNLTFGNAASSQVVSYQYSYSHGGNDYVCYMIFGVSPGIFARSGFVFTYTAIADEYELHWAQIQKILSKVEF